MIRLKKIIKSKIDNTQKFIFELNDGLVTEFSYINKEDGKIIICASTQTNCRLGCQFCHLTGQDIQETRNLNKYEIFLIICFVESYVLGDCNTKDYVLLISYMGIGEPLLNRESTLGLSEVSKYLYYHFVNVYDHVRFAVSTIVPKKRLANLFCVARDFNELGLDLKLHYSLHNLNTPLREELMPMAEDWGWVLDALHYIEKTYEVDIELHYTLVKGFNDKKNLLLALRNLSIPVKFLKLAEKEGFSGEAVSLEDYNERIKPLFKDYVEVEYYDPPGSDIGASCGQINIKEYLEMNM